MRKIAVILIALVLGVSAPFALAYDAPKTASEAGKPSQDVPVVQPEKSPWALDVFLHADHFKKSSRLNERNWGLGLKYYHPDTLLDSGGEFFAEVGGLRNSHRGEAHFFGVGYSKKLFEVDGVRVSGSIAPVYVNYGAAGKSATTTTILPLVSIGYGRWDMNTVYFSKHDGGFLLISAQYRF